MKKLFSMHLDEDLKKEAQLRAAADGRTLSSLIEVALRSYINPPGARVTVDTSRGSRGLADLLKREPRSSFTARIKEVDVDAGVVYLTERDPDTGRTAFNIDSISIIHLK